MTTKVRNTASGIARASAVDESAAGFGLIDVCVTLFICVIVIYALHSGTRTAMQTRKVVENNYQVQLFANDFIGRLRRLPFGNSSALPASPHQLDALFDADQDLGTVTFTQLRVAASADGYTFRIANSAAPKTWRIRVTSDLNGDGDEIDDREGRADLLRVEIYYDNRLLVETLRSADANLTTPDSSADYLTGVPVILPPGTSAPPSSPPTTGAGSGTGTPDLGNTDLLPAVEPGGYTTGSGR